MSNVSVLGKTKVSPALVQTGVAREEADFIAVEAFLLSVGIGLLSPSFVIGFLISFMILTALLSTRFWYVLSIILSAIWAIAAFIFTYAISSFWTAIIVGIFVFGLMLSKHHWSLAYWQALVDET